MMEYKDCDHFNLSSFSVRCAGPINTFVEFEKEWTERSVPDRFDKIATTYTDKTAVKSKSSQLTYYALDRQANRVARTILSRLGSKKEPVALFFEQGALMIAAMLGVLKTGKFYLPLDSNHPIERNCYILRDSGADLIITNNRNIAVARQFISDSSKLINIEEEIGSDFDGNPMPLSADDFAYII